MVVITHVQLAAALYAPAPARPLGTVGRPRKKGARQPTLAQRLEEPATRWQPLPVRWYGGVERAIEVATDTAVWYHSGLPPIALRWVLIRSPTRSPAPANNGQSQDRDCFVSGQTAIAGFRGCSQGRT